MAVLGGFGLSDRVRDCLVGIVSKVPEFFMQSFGYLDIWGLNAESKDVSAIKRLFVVSMLTYCFIFNFNLWR